MEQGKFSMLKWTVFVYYLLFLDKVTSITLKLYDIIYFNNKMLTLLPLENNNPLTLFSFHPF